MSLSLGPRESFGNYAREEQVVRWYLEARWVANAFLAPSSGRRAAAGLKLIDPETGYRTCAAGIPALSNFHP